MIVGRVDVVVEIPVDDTEAEPLQAANSTRTAEICAARSAAPTAGMLLIIG